MKRLEVARSMVHIPSSAILIQKSEVALNDDAG